MVFLLQARCGSRKSSGNWTIAQGILTIYLWWLSGMLKKIGARGNLFWIIL
jgi:hypothetical protein